MTDQSKPRTPAELIHQRASDLARDALDLQALAGLATDRELMHQLAAWCDGHDGGHGTFFEVQYGVDEKTWGVNLFLGRAYRHHRADRNVLKTSSTELEAALVEMLKHVQNVAPVANE